MAHQHSNDPQIKVLPPDKAKIRQLMKVFYILLGVTVLEFIIAFTMTSGVPSSFYS